MFLTSTSLFFFFFFFFTSIIDMLMLCRLTFTTGGRRELPLIGILLSLRAIAGEDRVAWKRKFYFHVHVHVVSFVD